MGISGHVRRSVTGQGQFDESLCERKCFKEDMEPPKVYLKKWGQKLPKLLTIYTHITQIQNNSTQSLHYREEKQLPHFVFTISFASLRFDAALNASTVVSRFPILNNAITRYPASMPRDSFSVAFTFLTGPV